MKAIKSNLANKNSKTTAAEFEQAARILQDAMAEVNDVVMGQKTAVKHLFAAILCGGHAMLIGVPGLAKTLLTETVGAVMGLNTRRIQFVPDLMPADITGSEILDVQEGGKRSFRFIPGPIFTELLMADEINRASPRTQSALLQAMQEKKVTVSGIDYLLPNPFHVLATRNPIEQEGTYPLPEAQLDRFILEIPLSYPSAEDELQIMLATTGNEKITPARIMNPEDLITMQKLVRDMPIGEITAKMIINIIRELRPEFSSIPEVKQHVAWGPGTRAGQAFLLASRAQTLLSGRYAPMPSDIQELLDPVLRHRVLLKPSARAEGITLSQLFLKAYEKSLV